MRELAATISISTFFSILEYYFAHINYDCLQTEYLLHQTLDNTPIVLIFNIDKYLSEEQVPSDPMMNYSTGSQRKLPSLGSENTWCPVE